MVNPWRRIRELESELEELSEELVEARLNAAHLDVECRGYEDCIDWFQDEVVEKLERLERRLNRGKDEPVKSDCGSYDQTGGACGGCRRCKAMLRESGFEPDPLVTYSTPGQTYIGELIDRNNRYHPGDRG